MCWSHLFVTSLLYRKKVSYNITKATFTAFYLHTDRPTVRILVIQYVPNYCKKGNKNGTYEHFLHKVK